MTRRAIVLATALFAGVLAGCGGGDDTPASITTDAGVLDTAIKDTPPAVGKIAVKVSYAGSKKGQLAVGAFTEAEPKSRPPASFDTSKTPVFPFSTTLTDLEPGRYWIVAVLDLEPFSGTAVKPGPEDLQATSTPVDVVAGETKTVEVTITDVPGDAGAETATDASSD